jgi:hypothetical protein
VISVSRAWEKLEGREAAGTLGQCLEVFAVPNAHLPC